MIYFNSETRQFGLFGGANPLVGRRRRERYAHDEKMAMIQSGAYASSRSNQTELAKHAMDSANRKLELKNADKADRRGNWTERHKTADSGHTQRAVSRYENNKTLLNDNLKQIQDHNLKKQEKAYD